MSTCSVAASYKPPMLVTRVRLPACAVFCVALSLSLPLPLSLSLSLSLSFKGIDFTKQMLSFHFRAAYCLRRWLHVKGLCMSGDGGGRLMICTPCTGESSLAVSVA